MGTEVSVVSPQQYEDFVARQRREIQEAQEIAAQELLEREQALGGFSEGSAG
jgi:hypothetical protein